MPSTAVGSSRDYVATETAPAMPQHRICFPQGLDDSCELRSLHSESSRKQLALFAAMGKKLVQRRIEQANRDRQSIHRLEDSLEIGTLHRKKFREGATTAFLVAGDDHLTHRIDAFALEEHVLGPAKADTFGAEVSGDARVARSIGVGSNLQCPCVVRPAEELRV